MSIYSQNMAQGAATGFAKLEDVVGDLAEALMQKGFKFRIHQLLEVTEKGGNTIDFATGDSPRIDVRVLETPDTDPEYNKLTFTFTYNVPEIYLPIRHKFGAEGPVRLGYAEFTLPHQEDLFYFLRNAGFVRYQAADESDSNHRPYPVWFTVNYDKGTGKMEASYRLDFKKSITIPDKMKEVLSAFISYVTDHIKLQAGMIETTKFNPVPEPRTP